jgi:hypothetical protein
VGGHLRGDKFKHVLKSVNMIIYRPHALNAGVQHARGLYRPFSSTIYIQRGSGLGSIFGKIWKVVAPLAKKGISVVAKAAKSAPAQAILKDIKKAAIDTGLEMASTALTSGSSGDKSVNDVLHAGVDSAKAKIANRLDRHRFGLLDDDGADRRSRGRKRASSNVVYASKKKKRKKKPKPTYDMFDY